MPSKENPGPGEYDFDKKVKKQFNCIKKINIQSDWRIISISI